MSWTDKRKFFALMAFHMLWGVGLWFSISKYGLGISTDSVHLLFGGLNLSMGRGLLSFDGSRLLIWPPLYPVLLALVQRISGLDIFTSAIVLQWAAFIGISICVSLLFLEIFPDNFLLAFAANLLFDLGGVVLAGFNMVGSDYVHLAFVILFIFLAGAYIGNNSARILAAMFAVGMLAMLQRYLGLAVIGSGAVIVFLFGGGAILNRLTRSGLLALSALPAAVWYFINSRQLPTRLPITFSDNFNWFSKSVLGWFFSAQALKPQLGLYIVFLWIFISALIVLVSFGSASTGLVTPYALAVFIFGIMYLLALFGSASVAYFNKLGGRFLLPLYLPFVTLLTVGVDALLRRTNGLRSALLRRALSVGWLGFLLVAAGLLCQVSLPLILESRAGGVSDGENVFNTAAWHENKTIAYWLAHRPQGPYRLFSNEPDGVAFYTRHSCSRSPVQFSGPYGRQEFPLSRYAADLFPDGQAVYIVWIEPNRYSYFYKVEELSPIARIDPLFVGGDGGVYRLTPSP